MSLDTVMKALDGLESKLNQSSRDGRALADRLLLLEQKGGSGALEGAHTGKALTLGELAAQELHKGENLDLLSKTRSVRLVLKAASDPLSTSSGRTIVSGGVGAPNGMPLGLQRGLRSRPSGGVTAVEYSRFTGTQGAAGQQTTEGSAKPAVRPDHTLITQNAITIAGWTKMSRQAVNDSAELRSAVDVTLMRSVGVSLDAILVNGGTGFTSGFEGLATAYTSTVYNRLVDAISEGVSTMQVAGFAPDLVALNPADWLAISVARGTSNDHYLSGSYLGSMPMEMRGLNVVLSPSVNAGSGLLMDSTHSEFREVDGFTIEVAYDGNDFTSNLVTVLGEMRVIPIFRTVGSARLITPMA